MVEQEGKKSSLKLTETYIEPSDIEPQLKLQIKQHLPLNLLDDLQEIIEEYTFQLVELKSLMSSMLTDKKVIEYLLCRLYILITQSPYVEIQDLYQGYYKELMSQTGIQFGDDFRAVTFYTNDQIPSIQKVARFINSKAIGLPPGIMLMESIKVQELQGLLREIYNFRGGRLTNLDRVLLWYPDYLKMHYENEKIILTGQGQLSIDQRYFIAIIAVSCYGCEYLYHLLIDGFLEAGGDPGWLSLTNAPQRWKQFAEVSLEFAYRPWFWKQNSASLQALTKGETPLSKADLLEAFVITSFYHSLCCLVLGIGILPEIDFPRDTQKDLLMKTFDQQFTNGKKDCKNEAIISILKQYKEDNKEEAVSQIRKEKSEKSEESLKDKEETEFISLRNNQLFEKFFGNRTVQFKSFDYKDNKDVHNIYTSDYNWKLHGFSAISNYNQDLANSINENNNYVTNLTLQSFGDTPQVDTKPYRKAMAFYVQNIHGYRHVEYDYKNVNDLLPKELKNYLKTLCCMPQNINITSLDKVPLDFKPYEVLHIMMLTIEAKFQIELMYGLLALEKL